jgi:LmbE family N-acetylglucosaminyl deacetylase
MAANEPGQPPLIAPAAAGDDHGDWVATFTVDLPVPSSALAIGAHPDDVEFGAGGTLAKWAAAGCVVHHLVCTDGSKGTWNADADLDELVATRQREQRAAAAALGAKGEVVFLGQVDGELDSGLALRSEVARWIRLLQPEVVLGHDPWKRYRLHPDHRHAGLLACDAVIAARDPHFFREHDLAAHRPTTLLLWEADVANHVEDVSAQVGDKLAGLEAHESQFESTMHAVDESQLVAFRDRIRARLAETGAPFGFGAAEVFARISDL